MSDRPIDNHLHFPDKRKGSIESKQHHCIPGSVSHESGLIRSLRVSVFDLKGGVDKVDHPEEVEDHQSDVLRHADTLLGWQDEATVDENEDDLH